MNRRVLATCLCAGLAFAMTSGSAHAQRGGGGWGWLDKLSGPGGFHVYSGFTSLCIGGGEVVRYECDMRTSRIWLNLGGSYARAGANPERGFPRVAILAFEPSLDLRVKSFDRVYLEWGFGYGIHHFKGAAFEDFWRMSFQPVRVGAVFPWDNKLLFQVRFTETYFVDGFTASDFGATGDFEARGELVPAIQLSVVLDWGVVFR